MSNKKFAYRRRLVAISCVALCGFSGMGLATAKTIVGNTDGLVVEDIDTNRRGSLTILLTPLNPYDEVPEGQLPPGGLAGTIFTVHKIKGIDLSTPEGWREAESLTLDDAKSADYDHIASATTDEWGRAVFENLPVGVYFVTAQTPTDGEHSYRQPQDMIVTIPMGEDSQWKYGGAVIAKFKTPEVPVTTIPTPPTVPTLTPDNPPRVTTTNPVPRTSLTTTPVVPVEINEPPGPGGSQIPGTTRGPGIDRLPMTGAAVIWAVVIALALFAGGFFLMFIGRRKSVAGSEK